MVENVLVANRETLVTSSPLEIIPEAVEMAVMGMVVEVAGIKAEAI